MFASQSSLLTKQSIYQPFGGRETATAYFCQQAHSICGTYVIEAHKTEKVSLMSNVEFITVSHHGDSWFRGSHRVASHTEAARASFRENTVF